MQIHIINGANLNLLGKREPDIYGNVSFENYFEILKTKFESNNKNTENNSEKNIQLFYYQSNIEGELINYLHKIGFSADGIILNAGAYTHTSIALADALASITTPALEVHISNIYAREAFRHKSYLTPKCIGIISGLGLFGYDLAIEYFKSITN